MTNKVLILVGTKKGAFVLESDAAAAVMGASRSLLRDMADEPCDRRSGHAERSMPAAAASGSVQPSGNRATSERPGRIRARAWPTRREKTPIKVGLELGEERNEPLRGRRSGGAVPQRRRRRVLEATLPGCGTIRHGPTGIRAAAGSSFIRWCRIPTTTSVCGSGSPPPACSTRLTAARPGKRATGGPGPTSCRRTSDYPEFGQCVHCLVMAPGMPDRLYQQNHCGMYRSDDGGRQWTEHRGGSALEFRLSGGGPSARSLDALPAAAQRRLGGPLCP